MIYEFRPHTQHFFAKTDISIGSCENRTCTSELFRKCAH